MTSMLEKTALCSCSHRLKDHSTSKPHICFSGGCPCKEFTEPVVEVATNGDVSKFFVPEEITEYKPAPFQLEDLVFLNERDWSANWSEMGCYKTTTVEWLIQKKCEDAEIKNPRILFITTKSGKGTYFQTVPSIFQGAAIFNVNAKEFKLRVNDAELPYPITEKKIPRDKPEHPLIFVAHYNLFTSRKQRGSDERKVSPITQILMDTDWDFVVLDEAHRIKNRKSNWTTQIKKLKSRYKHIMTGTGFINNPAEIWSLLHFLDKKVFSSYWHFVDTFCDVWEDDAGFKHIVGVKEEHKADFRNLIYTIGVRRTKAEVFPNLPKPLFSPVEVELSPTQRRMYNELKQQLKALDQKGVPLHTPNVLSLLGRLRQVTVATPEIISDQYIEELDKRVQVIKLVEPSSKLDALMEIIEGLSWDEDRKDQAVVFSNFRDPIALAKKRFDDAGITYIHMDTKDSDEKRYQKWAIEFPKKEHQIFICTLQLGSESISLTSASTCIFLDRSWSPKDNEQGVSRVWRPGQTLPANVIHINARDTTDKRIEQANIRKIGWFNQIFGEEE